jgi:hypothetical protein
MQVQRPSVFEELKLVDALVDQRAEPAMVEERLPFTVRVVRSEEDLLKAVGVRHSAYARHMPEFAESLAVPEDDDLESDNVVLIAESKLDGSALGSVRIQTNFERLLSVENSVDLPAWLQRRPLAEVRRLGVAQGSSGRLVKMILVKASFLYCERNGVEWAVLAARPPLNTGYEKLMFSDILAGETFVPLPRANNVAHHVMAFEIATGKARWTAANHPLLKFFSYTNHPDIDVGTPVAGRVTRDITRPSTVPVAAYSAGGM